MKELIQKVDNHDSRIERLEVLEGGGGVTSASSPPASPVNKQLWQDTTNDIIWIFDTSITDGSHPTGRWKTPRTGMGMQMIIFPPSLTPPAAPTQTHFMAVSNTRDAYIYVTNINDSVATTNNVGNTWQANNDHSTVNLNTLGGAGVALASAMPFNAVIAAGVTIRIFYTQVGTPGVLSVFSASIEYSLLF
jgi:hypothetical protein